MFVLLSVALAEDTPPPPAAPTPVAPAAAMTQDPRTISFIPQPPIQHQTFGGSRTIVKGGTLWESWVTQTPGWVTGPNPSLGGLPLDEVPLYVDGMRVGTADQMFAPRRGR
jgi:hypothetical protein